MPQLNDLTGKLFGKLKATGKYEKKDRRYFWECICDCGNKKTKFIVASDLVSGHTRSCGCMQLKSVTTHSLSYSKFYAIWRNMKQRCNNKNHQAYKYYGGRGIIYDPRWNNFLKFKKDMYQAYVFAKKKYRKELTKTNSISIERIDNNGNYCKDNCCWIPLNKQAQNKRQDKRMRYFEAISPKGRKYYSNNQSLFALQHGLNSKNINHCLKNKNKTHKRWSFRYCDV